MYKIQVTQKIYHNTVLLQCILTPGKGAWFTFQNKCSIAGKGISLPSTRRLPFSSLFERQTLPNLISRLDISQCDILQHDWTIAKCKAFLLDTIKIYHNTVLLQYILTPGKGAWFTFQNKYSIAGKGTSDVLMPRPPF